MNMKKGGLLLLAVIFLTYGYQGYKAIDAHVNDRVTIKTSGKLSDIAGRVTPVPLKMPGNGTLRDIRQVRKDRDDLFLLSENRLLHFDVRGKFVNRIAGIYPVRKGKRHIIATGRSLDGNRFVFCYDSARYTAHILTKGFKDDFFGTGYIADFLPVDIYGNSYCFVKSGEDLSAKFPERAATGDLPVLFIVNLNV
jgi:hypothetical protein